MRKWHFPERFQTVSLPHPRGTGGPFPYSIKTQHSRILIWRGKERGGRVGFVMFGEQNRRCRPGGIDILELLKEKRLLEQLFFQPYGHGHEKRPQSFRSKGQVRLEQALELQQRLVVEHNVGQIRQPDSARIQTITHRVLRKARVMFFSGEAFFLRGSDDLAVFHQTSCAVVIKGGNSKNVHSSLLTRCRSAADRPIKQNSSISARSFFGHRAMKRKSENPC